MTHLKSFFANTFVLIVLLSAVLTGVPGTRVHAEGGADEAIRKTLEARVRTHCRPLLVAWLRSEAGTRDSRIRAQVTDCYLSHSRMAALGLPSGLDIANTAISELPARILADRVDLNLDPFRPLAGRRIYDMGAQK